MGDMTHEQLVEAVDANFDEMTEQVFDAQLEGQLERVENPAEFRVTPARLKATSNMAVGALPANLRFAALANAGDWGSAASDAGSARTVNVARVVEEADDEKRSAAAEGIREYVCGQLRDWFEANLAKIKEWLKGLSIKEVLKKIAGVAKQLVVAAVTAIAGVVGSMFAAYLLIAVAVAAVGAAIYLLVKNGLPDYCPA